MTNHGLFFRQHLLRNWPFLLWLGALAFVVLFYSRNQQFGQMCGSVETPQEDVVPQETARLVAVHVKPGDRVKTGDLLAQMDTTLIDAELAIQDATLQDARETFSQYQRGMISSVNQAESAVKSAEADLQNQVMLQRSDEAEAEELRKELKRREGLLAKRLIDELQVNELRPQLAALEQALAAYPGIITNYQRAKDSAVAQLGVVQNWLRLDPSGSLSPALSNRTDSAAAIAAANREMCLRRRNAYFLRANCTGTVSRVFVWPGNVVPAGIPIMNIVNEQPRNVIGFQPEFQPVGFSVGQTVQVWRLNDAGGLFSMGRPRAVLATVESISPSVDALPVRISPMQVQVQGGVPLRGRRIVFRLPENHDFSPGETVEVRDIRDGWRGIPDRLISRLPPVAQNSSSVEVSSSPVTAK